MVSYEAAIYRVYSIYLPQMIAVWKGLFILIRILLSNLRLLR